MTSGLPVDPAQLDAWLVEQRWFRSRTRPLRAVTVHDSIELPVTDAVLLVLRASFVEGADERYLVPAMASAEPPREAADGDGVWRSLVALMADGPRLLPGRRGGLALEPGPALAALLPGGRAEAKDLTERALGVEQSNSSVRLGDRLMLKVYRLLEPGINPEVEVLELLTARGFAHAPLAAGSMRYVPDDAEPAAAGVVQSLIPARGDGWGWMLEQLGGPSAAHGQTIAAASQIGGVTAELHAALQSVPDRPGFPWRPATAEERHAWRTGAEAELEAALAAVAGEERIRLSGAAAGVRAAFDALTAAPGAWTSRIHGDYHLGQLLVTDDGFVVTDFEGEPARPLAERRRPASPLRDVAGLLRSLDYAARTTRQRQPGFAADAWLAEARSAFLTAYGQAADESLLRALELEKACYEVRYEANFRPGWSWLPLEAVERLAA
ncbi:MAG TPA: phosphotransferase [Candidatus Limnocylindria bacterium]